MPHLQQQHELCVVDVDGDVEGRLVKLAECVDVCAVLQQRLRHPLVAVLRRPVQRRHLQHVLGVDVSAALREKEEELDWGQLTWTGVKTRVRTGFSLGPD